MLDLRQDPNYARYMKNLGWEVEKIGSLYGYIKRFPLIGSFIKIQRPELINFPEIKKIITKYRAFQIIIEPKKQSDVTELESNGFKQIKSFFVPSKTILIDLSKPLTQLLKEMHHKTRYNIKLTTKNKNLKIEYSNDIKSFADFWQTCALKQRGMYLSQKKEIIGIYNAFGRDARIVLIYQNEELLAGILMVCTKNTAYYMFAASTDRGKKLFAPTLAAWETVKLAKKLKKKYFDFEGVFDERFPIKSWRGFGRFKKSFGGKEITYPGAFAKFRFPV